MRLLERQPDGNLILREFTDKVVPAYAILSHTWSVDSNEEVSFQDVEAGSGKSKAGWKKITFCADRAKADGLRYFWIDTCCIDKKNKAKLSQAIRSMFQWYRKATRCYVYLLDVYVRKRKIEDENTNSSWEQAFRASKWFTRGWTLQELLAPQLVEFFSQECQRLGDKRSLRHIIQEVTCIPKSALEGNSLSQFSANQRFLWMEHRQTKEEEDKAYSLLGIFGVSMTPLYGEGVISASKRLREEIDKLEKCMLALRVTDPRDDKKRIEGTKGGLLLDSYRWILEHRDFKEWIDGQQSHLLWIKGDPGKGKTMLLCGVVDELKSMGTHVLSFFFCQATDSRINSATAVLRGLLYLLIDQQPSLISHIRKRHDHAGKSLFEDANAWVTLSDIFTDILQDPSLTSTYLIIDALDECITEREKLLDFIAEKSSLSSPHVKWLVSSRNWPSIEEGLDKAGNKVRLGLELNSESVSASVKFYIQHKVNQLAEEKKYDDKTQETLLSHLLSNANDTFLWVALVCQRLKNTPKALVRKSLNLFPPGLDALYERMIKQVSESEGSELCKQILASIATTYEPITLFELSSLIEMLEDISDDRESLVEMIGLCGSFLTIRNDTIYFVHQSAKDFLVEKASAEIFPDGIGEIHHEIYSRSLDTMSRTLRRDIYGLGRPGYPIEQVELPDPDPLAASRYSCIYWVDHLCESESHDHPNQRLKLQDGVLLDKFVREKFLYWLEALSLCKSMPKGVLSMAKLLILIQVKLN
jgi:hypothetical protein